MGPPVEHVGRIKGKSNSELPRICASGVGRNAGRPAQQHALFMPLYLRAVNEREIRYEPFPACNLRTFRLSVLLTTTWIGMSVSVVVYRQADSFQWFGDKLANPVEGGWWSGLMILDRSPQGIPTIVIGLPFPLVLSARYAARDVLRSLIWDGTYLVRSCWPPRLKPALHSITFFPGTPSQFRHLSEPNHPVINGFPKHTRTRTRSRFFLSSRHRYA